MTEVRIEPLPTNAEVLRRLRALQAAGADMRPAMREIAETLLAHVERNFAAERAPDGSPWPLKPATRKARNRKGYTGPKLQRTRRLLDSVQARYDDESALVGTNLIYAATHQFGDEHGLTVRGATVRRRRGIPARPFLGFGPGDREELLAIIRRRLEAAIR